MITGNLCAFRISGGNAILTSFLVGIGEGEQSSDPLDRSVLADIHTRRYHPADLIEPGQFELRAFFNPYDDDAGGAMWGYGGGFAPNTPHDMLIEFQEVTTPGSPATLTGSGFFVGRVYPELINDQLAEARFMWQFDGYASVSDNGDPTAVGPIMAPETNV